MTEDSAAERTEAAGNEPGSGNRRDEFEYVVIGSGAGGGPVAANLAKAGHRVLVLEAGGNGNNETSLFKYEVPGADARYDDELGWVYWVNSRAHQGDREKQNFYVPGKGLYYPRGTSIGGSTTTNAMIALYPDNGDWDAIATLTGDRSWGSSAMRTYFERLGGVRYVQPEPGNPARLGFSGWLPMEQLGIKSNLLKDTRLTNYIVSRIRDEENGELFEEAARNGEDFRIDPNDWRAVTQRRTGMVDPPRSAENGMRRGTRELLLGTADSHPQNLVIRTDCLVTSLLFDEADPTRVIGVEYLEGRHLYAASWRAKEFSSQPGIRRQVLAVREVVVSAGAFNSPQILMLSGIGPADELKRHGIRIRVDRPGVGRNLQDRLETGVVCKLPFEPNIYKDCTWGAEGDPCKVELDSGAPDAAYRSRQKRQMYIVKRSSPDREVPNIVIFGVTQQFRGYLDQYDKPPMPAPGKDEFTWFTLSGHTKNTGGVVILKSPNPRDTPEINFNNFEDGTDADGEDLEALLRGVKMARRLAAGGADGPAEDEISPGRGCVTDDDLRQFIKNEAWGHHASCSNKMGPAEDPMAVVDSNFRVHGVKGLRVVDASVFPRIPGLFIVVPTYMIAEKASDAILADAAARMSATASERPERRKGQ
jgi:choline dehydrogenase